MTTRFFSIILEIPSGIINFDISHLFSAIPKSSKKIIMSDSENDFNASKNYEVESVLGRQVARNGEVCKSIYIGRMKNNANNLLFFLPVSQVSYLLKSPIQD